MFKKSVTHATRWGLSVLLAMVLVACSGGGGSGSSGGGTPGSLAFFPDAPVDVRVGNNYSLTLSLENSSGVAGQVVTVAVEQTAIATVDHTTCVLSSTPVASECHLQIKGIATGATRITASATGYASVSLPIVVSNGGTVNYGSLAVAVGPGDSNYTTSSPVNLGYPVGGQLKVYARIAGSQLLTSGTTIRFTPAAGSASPASCSVTTAQPLCSTTISGLPASGTTAITVSGLSTQGAGHTYSSIVVNATPQSTTNNGLVVISPDKKVNLIPNGMKGPVFANWQSVGSVADTPTLTLSISGWTANSPVSFYSFTSGNNTTPTKSGSVTCTMNTAQIDYGCGFGIMASADAGSVTITGSLTSANGQTYATPDPITITAIPNSTSDAVRVVTFTNTSTTENLWIGITGGAASAYLNPTTNAGSAAGQRIAKQNSQANSKCGPTNPRQACPMGSSCLQPGQNPSGDFVCFWDQPTPVPTTTGANPYLMAQGGTSSTKLYISKYSLAPGDGALAPIHWSGNFYARQQCSANGTCKIGSCNSAYSGGVGGCAPGTGASPLGVVTLGEVTFQATTASTAANAVSDYYDVSIINGVNKSLAFGVTTPSATDPYTNCGTAGSAAVQGGGYPANLATGIGTATWQLTPSAASYPAVTGVPTSEYSRFFRLVDADAKTATQCASAGNPNLGTCSASQVCGYAVNNTGTATTTVVQGGANFTGQDLYCGDHLAWITADTIYGVNQSATNNAPFGFNTSVTGVSVGNLQMCEGGSFSAYTNSAQGQYYACGGVAWDNQTTPVAGGPTMSPRNLTRVAEPVQWSNTNWISYVQPSLLWLKQACPSCYTYPFDDKSSTFQCYNAADSINYTATFGDTK
jgi:hypothetical protein